VAMNRQSTRIARAAAALFGLVALAACFHRAEALGALSRGTIAVEPAPGMDPDSLEIQSYQRAVARELARLGYSETAAGSGTQVALVRIERTAFKPGRERGPVSVGVGGSTGSYGSGVGVGIGFDLSGAPSEQVTTELGVMIRDRASGETLWEGRANFTVRASSPLAQTQLGAAKMAEAMFLDFPGNDGETVEIR